MLRKRSRLRGRSETCSENTDSTASGWALSTTSKSKLGSDFYPAEEKDTNQGRLLAHGIFIDVSPWTGARGPKLRLPAVMWKQGLVTCICDPNDGKQLNLESLLDSQPHWNAKLQVQWRTCPSDEMESDWRPPHHQPVAPLHSCTGAHTWAYTHIPHTYIHKFQIIQLKHSDSLLYFSFRCYFYWGLTFPFCSLFWP